ncbi:MAG TPA: radical SAM protein [bacterium]|nr:radical SAM protein [bacterium]
MSISALLKKYNHFVDAFITDKINEEILNFLKVNNPDYIGFSIMTGNHIWAINSSEIIKNNSILSKIIFGGVHPTIFPEIIENKNVDIICQGEGEYPLLELLNNSDKKIFKTNIKNLWFKDENEIIKNDLRSPMENLDELPFPDRSIYYKYKYFITKNAEFNSSRGCPYICSFCSSKIINTITGRNKKKYFTTKSPVYFVTEIENAVKQYPFIKRINFINEVFSYDDNWFYSFLELYVLKIKLPFVVFLRVDMIDEKKIKTLQESGCELVLFGVESGNEKIRKKILKKNISDKAFIDASNWFHKYKLDFITSNIVGLPSENLEEALDTVRFNILLKPEITVCSLLMPYPKTDITDMAYEQGLIPLINPNDIDLTFYKDTMLNLPHKKEIVNLQRLFLIFSKYPFVFYCFKNVLLKAPNNIIFDWLFLLSYFFYQKIMYQRNYFETLKFGLMNFKLFKK